MTTNPKQVENPKDESKVIIPAILFFGVVLVYALINKRKQIFEDLQTFSWWISVAIISSFSIAVLRTDHIKDEGMREATKKALMALFIAYLAHLKMRFAPFFLVFIFDYYTNQWV
jgi:hypothetical protein